MTEKIEGLSQIAISSREIAFCMITKCYCGEIMTTTEIAGEFGLPQTIVDYKLEALRLRGYDLDAVELVSYKQVFRCKIEKKEAPCPWDVSKGGKS